MCGGLVATVVSGGAWLLLLAASLGGTLSTDVTWTLLTETRFGQVSTVRLILAVLIAAEAALPPPRSDEAERVRGLAMTVCAMGLLGNVALIGHAGATPGVVGDLHLASDVVHLVAAGAWLGGLPPFALLLATAERSADRAWTDAAAVATQRFSIVGAASVVALALTGTANTWFMVGGPAGLATTDYGRLVALKICLFAAMVGVAAFNRLHLTPRLAAPGTVRRLRRNSLIETGLGLLVIAIVSALGTMAPEIHRMH